MVDLNIIAYRVVPLEDDVAYDWAPNPYETDHSVEDDAVVRSLAFVALYVLAELGL